MLFPLIISSTPIQAVYAKEEDLQNAVEENIKDYEAEFRTRTFEIELSRSIKKSPHKSQGLLLEKLIQTTRLKFMNDMKLKLKDEFPKIWEVYQNGLRSGFLEANDEQPPILLLGTKQLRLSSDLVRNFKLLNHEQSKTGCIFSGTSWSILKNDLVILSAIHTRKVVMFFLPEGFTINCLWNSERSTPSMLCREITILLAAGYRRLSYSHENQLGYVLTSRSREIANAFALNDVAKCCANIKPELVESLFLHG